jgi:hypothetical protein
VVYKTNKEPTSSGGQLSWRRGRRGLCRYSVYLLYEYRSTNSDAEDAMCGDSDGCGSNARFRCPFAVLVEKTNNIIVADGHNHRLRMIAGASAHVTTLAGGSEKGLQEVICILTYFASTLCSSSFFFFLTFLLPVYVFTLALALSLMIITKTY